MPLCTLTPGCLSQHDPLDPVVDPAQLAQRLQVSRHPQGRHPQGRHPQGREAWYCTRLVAA